MAVNQRNPGAAGKGKEDTDDPPIKGNAPMMVYMNMDPAVAAVHIHAMAYTAGCPIVVMTYAVKDEIQYHGINVQDAHQMVGDTIMVLAKMGSKWAKRLRGLIVKMNGDAEETDDTEGGG